MEVFIIFFIYITIFIGIFSVYKNKKLMKYIVFISGLYLGLLSGLRDVSVGIDTGSYYSYFMRDLEWNEIAEYYHYQGLLFWYFLKYVYDYFYEYQLVLVIVGLISVFFISRHIWKYSRYPLLSLMIYVSGGFFSIGLSLVRQYLALSVLVYSIDYIIQKKFKYFLLLLIIAFFIHPSSILFLPAYFFANRKINKKNTAFYLLGLCGSFVLASIVIDVMSYVFFNGLYVIETDKDAGGKITFLAYLVVLMIAFFRRNELLINNINNQVFFNLLWIATIIQSTAFVFPIASRVAYMYSIFLITFIPEIIYSFKSVYYKILFNILTVSVFLIIYFYKFYNLNNVYPYKFFFE